MCGICGFNTENKALLKKMCDLIEHRGPDNSGFYIDSEISLGMRRLSIIDLKTGSQPQHNEDESMWIVYNGEIYNFQDLRIILERMGHTFYTASDTEVVLHSYEEWGEACLHKLRGHFVFCIYDRNKKILFIARDSLGIKPLYYYFDGNRFIFGSEIKCILLHGIEKSVNKNALNSYISLKYVPFEQTLFNDINKVPAASYLIFDLEKKKLKIKKFWDLHFEVNYNKDEAQFARELRNLIEESVKIRLISEVPLGAFLSGGIDSSTVVGLMSKYMEEPVKTFSIGFEEGAPVNETKYAKLVSEHFNTNHTELLVKSTSIELLPKLIWHLDDLISDAAIIPVYVMAKLAKEKMTVALTGDGADEVFAGYSSSYQLNNSGVSSSISRIVSIPAMKMYNLLPSQTIKMAVSHLYHSKSKLDRFLRTISLPDEEKAKIFPFKTLKVKDIIKSKLNPNLDIVNQIAHWDMQFQLPSQFNMKADKMSNAASLELRVPFLDSKIIEYSATIPPSLKLHGNIEKYILRLAVKDLLPPEILNRKKMGFTTPMNLWLRTGLKEVSDELLERLAKRKSLFKSKYIKNLKKHRFKKMYENRVWNFLMFEIWYETFMENDGLKPILL